MTLMTGRGRSALSLESTHAIPEFPNMIAQNLPTVSRSASLTHIAMKPGRVITRCRIGALARTALLLGVFSVTGLAVEKPFTPVEDTKGSWTFTADPKLPNVLILGDSISIGYTRAVRGKLAGKANLYRPMKGKGPDNCGDTTIGLGKIDAWLGTQKWDVIHFNWGLWDLCYRNPTSKSQGNRDKVGGKLSTTPENYEKNLEQLVTRLEATGAKLIWASTTVVPEGEDGRFVGDDAKYNAVAERVMKKHHIATDDLFTLSKGFAGKFSTKAGDVHFTPEGYEKLAEQVSASIEKLLPEKAVK